MNYYSMIIGRTDSKNEAYQQLAANIVLQACNDYIEAITEPRITEYINGLIRKYTRTKKEENLKKIYERIKEICDMNKSSRRFYAIFGGHETVEERREAALRYLAGQKARERNHRKEALERFFNGRLFSLYSGGGIEAEMVLRKLNETAQNALKEMGIGEETK